MRELYEAQFTSESAAAGLTADTTLKAMSAHAAAKPKSPRNADPAASRSEFVLPLTLERKDVRLDSKTSLRKDAWFSTGELWKNGLLKWDENEIRSTLAAFTPPAQPVVSEYFRLLDANQRVEIRRSGSYRLRLHVEQKKGNAASAAKFSVEVNGLSVLLLRPDPVSSSSDDEPMRDAKQVADDRVKRESDATDEVPWKCYGVTEVKLNSFDTVAVRAVHRRAARSEVFEGSDLNLVFGRFVIEALCTTA